MPYILAIPTKHKCNRPSGVDFGVGTVWQCDQCYAIHVIVHIIDDKRIWNYAKEHMIGKRIATREEAIDLAIATIEFYHDVDSDIEWETWRLYNG